MQWLLLSVFFRWWRHPRYTHRLTVIIWNITYLFNPKRYKYLEPQLMINHFTDINFITTTTSWIPLAVGGGVLMGDALISQLTPPSNGITLDVSMFVKLNHFVIQQFLRHMTRWSSVVTFLFVTINRLIADSVLLWAAQSQSKLQSSNKECLNFSQ